ncbi:hypothetical protein GQR58_003432 [Nymphon striatum]|nr:hypothetical protein GQR58_003432 [Nymphon striatum]
MRVFFVWHAEFRLYLYPEDPVFIADLVALRSLLSDLKFIDKNLEKNRYSTGDNFVSLLTFMGCSPNIELEPQEDKPFCYIEIDTTENPTFVFGKNTKSAVCIHCKKTLKNQTSSDILFKIRNVHVICSNCKETMESRKLNWRKSAFIASSWICIGNIYEMEAIPNDQLLTGLQKETGVIWKSAYVRANTN